MDNTHTKKPLAVFGFHGLGDSVYQRPAIAALAQKYEVFLSTCWPQVYWDMPQVKFVMGKPIMAAQSNNIARLPLSTWSPEPHCREADLHLQYDRNSVRDTGIRRLFGRQAATMGVTPVEDFHLPLRDDWMAEAQRVSQDWPRHFALVRPVTLYRRWANIPRNPDPVALSRLAESLRGMGVFTVSLTEADGESEQLLSDPDCDLNLRGGFEITTVLALQKLALCTVGGVGGLTVPCPIATGAAAFVVYGGCGGDNHPGIVTDSGMDLSRWGYVTPSPLCMCHFPQGGPRRCNKYIEPHRLLGSFKGWIENLPRGCTTR